MDGEDERERAASERAVVNRANLDRSAELRRQFAELAADVARVEALVADFHERTKTDDPVKHARNAEIARQARDVAQRAQQAAERAASHPLDD